MEEKNLVTCPSLGDITSLTKAAEAFSKSTIVPKAYRGNASNCFVAIDLAARLNYSPLMIMQNMYILHGEPSWKAQFVIAQLNRSSKYESLQYKKINLGIVTKLKYIIYKYENGESRSTKYEKEAPDFENIAYIAYAKNKQTGEIVESTPVTIEMAIKEGWYFKDGSKWQTMQDQMGYYRAACFFARLYDPESLQGMYTVEEMEDMGKHERIRDITPKKDNKNNKDQSDNSNTQNSMKKDKKDIKQNENIENIIIINTEDANIADKTINCYDIKVENIYSFISQIKDAEVKTAIAKKYRQNLSDTNMVQSIIKEIESILQNQNADIDNIADAGFNAAISSEAKSEENNLIPPEYMLKDKNGKEHNFYDYIKAVIDDNKNHSSDLPKISLNLIYSAFDKSDEEKAYTLLVIFSSHSAVKDKMLDEKTSLKSTIANALERKNIEQIKAMIKACMPLIIPR